MLLNQLAYLGLSPFQAAKANAQTLSKTSIQEPYENHNEHGLIAILVENSLLDDAILKDYIFAYAQNAQDRVPHSKAFVMEIGKNESTYRIATTLEKLYYEGIDADLIDESIFNNDQYTEDDNKLAGIVIIGDIPIPVVEEDETMLPSIYPYTDFYRKKFIYNHETQKFELNNEPSSYSPEVWHGVIVPPSKDEATKIQELKSYFAKNNAYSEGDPEYAEFDKRMLYANYPAMEENMNFMDYRNYERYGDYMEEMAFYRYNKHLLKELIKEVSEDMGSDEPIMPDETINGLMDTATDMFFSKYTTTFAKALSIYRGKINDKIKELGMWTASEIDTPEALVAMRDEYAKYDLRLKQQLLEGEIDEEILDEMDDVERAMEVIIEGEVKIKLEVLGIDGGTESFTFYSFVDGQKITNITSANECGIYKGSQRDQRKSVLEDNSVLVKANQMFSPNSNIIPPDDDDDWELEEQDEYINSAGCVFNNSIQIDYEDDDVEIHLGPSKCIEEEAIESIYDITGSYEVSNRNFESGDCSLDIMSFHTGNDADFEKTGAGASLAGIEIGKTMGEVVNDIYNKLYNNGTITTFTNTQRGKATEVLKALIKTKETVKYEPLNGVDISVWVEEKTKDIDSLVKHTEPTSATIAAIKKIGEPTMVDGGLNYSITPSIPSDGIRYIQLAENGNQIEYIYPNIYRIEGGNEDEIISNLSELISNKQSELGNIIGNTTNIISRFFAQNSETIEPIIWKTLGTDQKLAEIIPKYLDGDGLMPTPDNRPLKYPQNRPAKGYEVMHIVANGDTWGYQFGLNRAMMKPSAGELLEDKQEGESEGGDGDDDDNEDLGGGGDGDNNYLCGDPSGVEIWEWFDALQCWIEEEILPAGELFKLDNSCGANMPDPEESEDPEIYVDPFDDTANIPTQLNAVMERKSLVPEQSEVISLYPLNSDGDSVMGYIDAPVHLELSNPDIGEFDKNDFNIFTGEEHVTFTAKETGTSQVTITMGDVTVQPSITINVYDSIDITWSDEKYTEGVKTKFTIGVQLQDPSGNRIRDVNTYIPLGPSKPTDGGFENNGRIQLIEGQGEITFEPVPGPTEIILLEKDEYITDNPYTIYPPPNVPVALSWQTPSYIPIGEETIVTVEAIDMYGVVVTNFNESISVEIDEATEEFANISNSTLNLSNGRGTLTINAGKESGEILLSAIHPELEEGLITLPILARINSDKWKNLETQNLFASFIGFPAGNFFEEGYFGGTHLFNGKTEAVYSFLTGPSPAPILTVDPNYKINLTQPQQIVYVEPLGNKLLLQAFDLATLKTLVSKSITLDFDEIILWEDDTKLELNNAYVELLDSTYEIEEGAKGEIRISDIYGNLLLYVNTNRIYTPNANYKLSYNPDPEFNLIEIILEDSLGSIARLMLNLEPEFLEKNSFESIDGRHEVQKIFGGDSTNSPNGIVIFSFDDEIEEGEKSEYYGMERNANYIQLFAGGESAGEAVKYNMPTNAILLGDPTIKLETDFSGGLNYDKAKGNKIYQDHKDVVITSINHFNFNNDGYEDVALVMKDGRIRLLEGGATEPILEDRGDIAFLADGSIAVEAFDFKNDNYEDLLVATDEGRLAILHNDKEVITRTDQKIKVGKKLYQLIKGDMDADGFEDLVTLDSRGDIRIFYNENNVIPENGTLIGNYGFSLKLGKNLQTDLDVRYPGLQEPTSSNGIDTSALPQISLPTPAPAPSGSQNDALQNFLDGNASAPSEEDSQALYDAMAALAEAAREDPAAFADSGETPKLPWAEGDDTEVYFAPVEDMNFFDIKKTVYNKERPKEGNIDLEENLVYTIEITPYSTVNNLVFADTIPDALSMNLDSATCEGSGCNDFEVTQNGIRTFFSGINLYAGAPLTITYEATVAHTPQANIVVTKLEEPTRLSDPYLDIMVSPPYNTTGDWLQHYTISERSYALRSTTEDRNANPPSEIESLVGEHGDFINALKAFGEGEYDEDNPPDLSLIEFPEGTEEALSDATGGDVCFDADFETGQMQLGCSSKFLDDVAGAISEFACMGGGCFPIPWNYTFMVPQTMPFPLFAFPTTLTTPVGPMPFIWPGSPLGMTDMVPGPIMSMLRIYTGISLTGGMGIGLCWGPYMGSSTPPPPMVPIPYPPPIGNCMVTALPTDALPWGKACGVIEDGINQLMEWINSGINKANSAMAGINNNQSIPLEFSSANQGDSAGGLEIGLELNLGESMNFEPPAKGFGNTHIPAFDSLGGVISSWVDRQTLEIINKLLTLPTFYVYLPDIKSIFSLDWDNTKKQANIWYENISKSPAVTSETLDTIEETGGSPLDKMDAVEAQARIYNMNLIEGMYDIASAVPFVNITERVVEFKVPWLSAAEIQAYILELEEWVIYYEREFNRVKDKWEKLTCSAGGSEGDTAAQTAEEAAECAGKAVADAFTADFDAVLESVQENIEVLQSYLAFPRQFVKYKQQLAGYISTVACYIDTIAQMLGGWYGTIKEQVITWAEMILTIIEIIKNIEKLIDLFINFDTSCSICTNERWANFGWWMLLGLILPDIPIISFPKWPDVVFDISDMDAAIDIELPVLRLSPEPIPLPPLPRLQFPDFPTFDLMLSLPPLPILPRLPEFPDLPELPPIPTLELPTLPPPPKLPDVGKPFELIIPIIEQILQIWCLIKKSLAPVPESMLGDQITLLTNRPLYMIPLDMLKIQIPNIALFDLGFNEMRIETIVYLGLRIKAVPMALEEASSTWNSWIEAIPDAMNEAYAVWIDAQEAKVQEQIDAFEDEMKNTVQGWEDTAQEGIDIGTDALEEEFNKADAYLREQEAKFQKWADDQELEIDYQAYVNAIDHANESMQNGFKIGGLEWPGFSNLRDNIDQFFDDHRDIIHGMNYLIPLAGHLELLEEYNIDKDKKVNVLENVDQKMGEAQNEEDVERINEYLEACLEDEEECDNEDDYLVKINNASPEQLALTSQLIALTSQLKGLFNQIENSEPVDYKKIKEELGVPDYELEPRINSADKIKWMEGQLIAYKDKLLQEAEEMKNVKDIYALTKVKPISAFEGNALAASEKALMSNEEEPRTITSAITPNFNSDVTKEIEKETNELLEKFERKTKATGDNGSNADGNNYCGGACLPDPITSQPTSFIPIIDNVIYSETLFMPDGNVIYSDGPSLYLKKDLTIEETDVNTSDDVGNKVFELESGFLSNLRQYPYPMEAVNMLKTTLTENGSATFTWLPTTNPTVYGYGVEVERSILGFDTDEQNNNLPDTRFVLLPPNEDGSKPPVYVNGQEVEYGTLITSIKNAEDAKEYFGIKPNQFLTGVTSVTFPTIGNATITLTDNTAVYFDKYTGSSYTVNMVNGFYHIKATWFDQYGRTATYNQNELLAPQIYVQAAPPIDIAFDKEFYVPIYKDKTIKASDVFVDLAGAYNYYWYVDTENNPLTPEVGSTLKLPPQKVPKEFLVKLIATQNIEDELFEQYEKIFKVIVYVPEIELDPEALNEGRVEGTMLRIDEAPIDDISHIPFSIFRKRWNTWKNLGLIFGDRTVPPLNDHDGKEYEYDDSYYSINKDGLYSILGADTTDPSPVIFKNENAEIIARVNPGTGIIEILLEGYHKKVLPASVNFPTRITIIETETDLIVGNVYYVPDSNTDINIVSNELNSNNVLEIGVTVGDANTNDDIIAVNIPGYSPSYPGGVAIYNQTPPQKNIALIDTDGSIRMMQAGYELKIKNEGSENERYIFQIETQDGDEIFDVYIHAEFDDLNIKRGQIMDSQTTTIGFNEVVERLIAQSSNEESIEAVQTSTSPFPDLDSSHPFFNEILNLYEARVVSGYGDGSFKPDEKLTRAEFIKIALGVTNCYDCTMPTDAQKAKYKPLIPFPDVRLPAWYYYCIWIAKDLAMITGYGDGLFKPSRNISRAEAAAVLLRQSEIEITEAPENAFLDVPDYAWYKDYVYTAVQIGLVKNLGGFVFPDEEITRGEFAFMGTGVMNMYDCHEVDEDGDGMPDWWEVENNLDPLYAGDAPVDNDNDGRSNLQEWLDGTDPNVADTKEEPAEPEGICPCIDNPNQNDTDGDGTIDACDEDLDGDGINNAICMFDDSGIIDEDIASTSEDNCIFNPNEDQLDSDLNAVGDICEPLDECPPVPEDYDGVVDEDGCPEVDDEFEDNDPGIYINDGPACTFIDYESDLVEGDVVMTAITDIETHITIFTSSNEATYQP